MDNLAALKACGGRLAGLGAAPGIGFQFEGQPPAVSAGVSPRVAALLTFWRSWKLPAWLMVLGLLTVAVRPEARNRALANNVPARHGAR